MKKRKKRLERKKIRGPARYAEKRTLLMRPYARVVVASWKNILMIKIADEMDEE